MTEKAHAPYKVLIVEPDEYRQQKHKLDLMRDPDFTVTGTFTGKREAVLFLHRHPIDFLVVNTLLADGNAAELIRTTLKRYPEALVLAATDTTQESTIMQTVTAGANGYVLLSENKTGIASCLKLMLSGGSPVSPTIARTVLRTLQCRAAIRRSMPEDSPLSPRELDIVRLMAKGISFQEISEILAISLHTVTTHIKKIYRKLNVHSRSEAVYEARMLGIVE